MFVGITNTPRNYAWGSHCAISKLLGTEPTGTPEAELWLGSHAGSPAVILDPSQTDGAADLASWIAADPEGAWAAAGQRARLPFLLKVLAAASLPSLQAHPSAQQAIAGFAREQSEGIPLDAPDRNHKDAYPKPEIISALADALEALCGFRPAEEVRQTIQRLIELDVADPDQERGSRRDWLERTQGDTSISDTFEWLISAEDGVRTLIRRVVSGAHANQGAFATVELLADAYPGDAGGVISLMLNLVIPNKREALYLPADNIHAYLKGIGIELVTASDSVLRGELTPKRVDVSELLSVLDFTPVPVPYEVDISDGGSVLTFRPVDVEFQLEVVTGPGIARIDGPAIIPCTDGAFTVTGVASSQTFVVGQSYFVTPDERELVVAGVETLLVATSH